MLSIFSGSRYRDELLINALCIDFVHGGAYAWTYLAIAGVPDRDILRILALPAEAWCYLVPNAEAAARSAMRAVGMHRLK